MRNNFREIAQFMDSVNTPTSMKELIDIHRWNPEFSLGDKSFRKIVNRHISPNRVESNFLFLNTFLMDVWSNAGGSKKPAVRDRAEKIGELIRNNYDIALLTEIFEDNVKDIVLKAWPDDDKPFVVEEAKRGTADSSGLVTISKTPLNFLINQKIHEFDTESGIFSDGLADKGIMLARISLGSIETNLELYSTHLDSQKADVRASQIEELVEFIRSTHQEQNVAILAGDFNIDSRNSEYVNLINSLEAIGFNDSWTQRNGTPGYTNLSEDNSLEIGNQICKIDLENPQFCDDNDVPLGYYRGSARIDYVFMSEPTSAQAFNLDFTRPRRIRHARQESAPKYNDAAFLSDHLGLSTKLILNLK